MHTSFKKIDALRDPLIDSKYPNIASVQNVSKFQYIHHSKTKKYSCDFILHDILIISWYIDIICVARNLHVMAKRRPCSRATWHWGADHIGHFRHHPSASSTLIVWKVMGRHSFLNIISNNFTVGIGRKLWCDWGMSVYVLLKNRELLMCAWKEGTRLD